jgi:hypothetical protein
LEWHTAFTKIQIQGLVTAVVIEMIPPLHPHQIQGLVAERFFLFPCAGLWASAAGAAAHADATGGQGHGGGRRAILVAIATNGYVATATRASRQLISASSRRATLRQIPGTAPFFFFAAQVSTAPRSFPTGHDKKTDSKSWKRCKVSAFIGL